MPRKTDRLVWGVLLFTCMSGAAYLATAVWVGWREVLDVMARLGAGIVLVGLAATLANYLLRFLRWVLILGRMDQRVPWRSNLVIYLSGLALTATPGKVGETVRSALLVRFSVPVSVSLTAFFVDRLADLTGVLLLAAVTAASGMAWGYAALALGAALAGASVPVLGPRVLGPVVRLCGRFARVQNAVRWLHAASAHIGGVWRPRWIGVMIGVAMVAYGLQAAVFALYASTLWPAIDAQRAFHYFIASTLVGAASMLPGGIGAMEASLIALLVADGMPLPYAVAAAFAIRAVTLWFGIALGVASVLWAFRNAKMHETLAANP